GEREIAARVLEGPHQQKPGRQDQEHRREQEERDNPDPRPGYGARPGGRCGHAGRNCVDVLCHMAPPIADCAGYAEMAGCGKTAPASRRGPVGSLPYFTLAPTTVSHCLVIASLPAFCSSRVGKTALA